jgi:hypothetical protein
VTGRDRHGVEHGEGPRRPARTPRPPRRETDAEPRRPTARGYGERAARRAAAKYDDSAGQDDSTGRYDTRAAGVTNGGRGYDQRSGVRPAAKYDDRRGSASAEQRRQDSLPAVRPRPARGKRSDGQADWPSTDWDELSDVDYWAEVASDKPLATTARPAAQGRPARTDQNGGAGARQVRGGRTGPASHPEPVPELPVRGPRQPAAAPPSAAVGVPVPAPVPADVALPAAAGRSADFVSPPLPATTAMAVSRSRPAGAVGGDPNRGLPTRLGGMPPRSPQSALVPDDDPLTSPSFPKVPAADSRSYRNGRIDTPPSGSSSSASYGAPTQQFAAYGPPASAHSGYGPPSAQTGYGSRPAQADYGSPSAQAGYESTGQFDSYAPAVQRPAAHASGYNEQQPAARASEFAPSADGYAQPGRQSSQYRQPGGSAAAHAGPQPYAPAAAPAANGYREYSAQAGRSAIPAYQGSNPALPASALPASALPAPAQLPAAASARPAPASAQGSPSGNPYGSYVGSYPPGSPAGPTDRSSPAGYGGHAAGAGSDQRSPYQQATVPGVASAAQELPADRWYPELPAPPGSPASYLDVSRPLPSATAPGAGYRDGSVPLASAGYPDGQPAEADYLPVPHPVRPHDAPADGYAGPDPYGREPYGGYPEHGGVRR